MIVSSIKVWNDLYSLLTQGHHVRESRLAAGECGGRGLLGLPVQARPGGGGAQSRGRGRGGGERGRQGRGGPDVARVSAGGSSLSYYQQPVSTYFAPRAPRWTTT